MRKIRIAITCVLAACSSSHESKSDESEQSSVYYHGEGPYPRVAEDDYVMAQAALLADEQERCCDQAGLPSSTAYERALEQFAHFTQPDPASGARYDPAAAGACLASLKERECALGKEWGDKSEACGALYTGGRRKLGEPCRTIWDCAAQAGGAVYCLGALGDNESVCTLLPEAEEGEDCTAPRTSCKGPLLCHPTRGVCVPPAGLGEACITGPSLGDTCRPGSVCDRNGSKRCVKPKAVGARCEALEDCEYLACVDGTCREPLAVISVCQ